MGSARHFWMQAVTGGTLPDNPRMTPIRCLLALTSLLIATAGVAQTARSTATPNLVLVLQAPDRAFPLTLVRAGAFSPFELTAESLQPGQRVQLHQAGAHVGEARVDRLQVEERQGCSEGSHAVLATPLPVANGTPALVTTRPLKDLGVERGAAVTDADRAAARDLARTILARHQAPAAALADTLAALRVSVVRIERAGPPVLVASSHIENQDNVQTLFFVAERTPQGTHAATYEEFFRGGAGASALMEMDFVDHADLDDDGIAELVYAYAGYEWTGYGVLKRHAGGWTAVHAQAVGGC
ncbi:hypothetical protein ASE08_22030 [Rhizobacter sp. Root16D2]|nr:hypothetical protein ASC88_16865 [Rhizobacter sp. Root29]KQW13801.1 hypothetical protein ASC98_16995 [Rhizobacter sp. Root1238]KRB20333.1 hypothetical protein ASE08_22030 [Rhizobacter sp. Root16D2]